MPKFLTFEEWILKHPELADPDKTCADCKGSGEVECMDCEGSGEVECMDCDGGKVCPECGRKCETCDGSGKEPCVSCGEVAAKNEYWKIRKHEETLLTMLTKP